MMVILSSIIYLISDQDSESWRICMEKRVTRIATESVNERVRVGVELS